MLRRHLLSTNGGSNWVALAARSQQQAGEHAWLLPQYMRQGGRMGTQISDLKIDPFDSDRAVYGTGFGVFMTGNLRAAQQAGASVDWQFVVRHLELATASELTSPSEGATLVAAMNNVAGAGWGDIEKAPNTGLFTPSGETNRSVDHAELSPVVVVRTSDQAATGGYVSLNGAISWRPFGPSARATRAPNGDHLGAGRVAVSAKGGFVVWALDRQPATWPTNIGKTWKTSQGWPGNHDVSLVPVADRAIEGVFYVHDRAGGKLLISVDGAVSRRGCFGRTTPGQASNASTTTGIASAGWSRWRRTHSSTASSTWPPKAAASWSGSLPLDERVGTRRSGPGWPSAWERILKT